MNKITSEHLARQACVYIRQSTPDQVQNNLESKRRQYALVDRARQLGWEQSLTTTSGARARAPCVPALSDCWHRFAVAKSVPC
jgi:hypothetical protein